MSIINRFKNIAGDVKSGVVNRFKSIDDFKPREDKPSSYSSFQPPKNAVSPFDFAQRDEPKPQAPTLYSDIINILWTWTIRH